MKSPTRHQDENKSSASAKRTEATAKANLESDQIPIIEPQSMNKLLKKGDGSLRRAAVLQMQRRQGNAYVQRFLANHKSEGIQRPADIQKQEDEQEGASTSIGDGSASVTAAGGMVKAEGAKIDLNAAMVETGGVLKTGVLMADSVIASSYSPGAGNIW